MLGRWWGRGKRAAKADRRDQEICAYVDHEQQQVKKKVGAGKLRTFRNSIE